MNESKRCTKCKEDKPLSEFYKNKKAGDGLYSYCKPCAIDKSSEWKKNNKERCAAYIREWKKNNKDKHKASVKKYRQSLGFGVYKVEYPSGVYIGSGLLQARIDNHISGNAEIAKTLGEKAMSVTILSWCSKENCKMYEQLAMDSYGMDNLLNTRRALK